eukprot:GHVH01008024.1.p1 GENE.GHVH01008024.1~~GHVH01008024.1.p1  ORF type:complete len:913 (+),score=132.02 GHVH01008024.1:139-2739(+)
MGLSVKYPSEQRRYESHPSEQRRYASHRVPRLSCRVDIPTRRGEVTNSGKSMLRRKDNLERKRKRRQNHYPTHRRRKRAGNPHRKITDRLAPRGLAGGFSSGLAGGLSGGLAGGFSSGLGGGEGNTHNMDGAPEPSGGGHSASLLATLPSGHSDDITRLIGSEKSTFWAVVTILRVILHDYTSHSPHDESFRNGKFTALRTYLNALESRCVVAKDHDASLTAVLTNIPDLKSLLSAASSNKDVIEIANIIFSSIQSEYNEVSENCDQLLFSNESKTQHLMDILIVKSFNDIDKLVANKMKELLKVAETEALDDIDLTKQNPIRSDGVRKRIVWLWIDRDGAAPPGNDKLDLQPIIDSMALKDNGIIVQGLLPNVDIKTIDEIDSLEEIEKQENAIRNHLDRHKQINIGCPIIGDSHCYLLPNGVDRSKISSVLRKIPSSEAIASVGRWWMVSPDLPPVALVTSATRRRHIDTATSVLIKITIPIKHVTMDTGKALPQQLTELMDKIESKTEEISERDREKKQEEDELEAIRVMNDRRRNDRQNELKSSKSLSVLNNANDGDQSLSATMIRALSQKERDNTGLLPRLEVHRLSKGGSENSINIGDEVHVQMTIEPGDYADGCDFLNRIEFDTASDQKILSVKELMNMWNDNMRQRSSDRVTLDKFGKLSFTFENSIEGIDLTSTLGRSFGFATCSYQSIDKEIKSKLFNRLGVNSTREIQKLAESHRRSWLPWRRDPTHRDIMFYSLPMLLHTAMNPSNNLHVGDEVVFKNLIGPLDNINMTHEDDHVVMTQDRLRSFIDRKVITRTSTDPSRWFDYTMESGKFASLQQGFDVRIRITCVNCTREQIELVGYLKEQMHNSIIRRRQE